MLEERIDKSNFDTWKQDIVTKEVFKILTESREEINRTLNNADVLLGENATKVVPRLIGMREGLDLILQISFEELTEEL